MKTLIQAIKSALTNEDRLPQYRNDPNPMRGHCYVASEVLYHMTNKKLQPKRIKHENSSHWFLYDSENDEIIDITASQFKTPVHYELARGCGFLTLNPSKRAQTVMKRLR